MSFDEEYLDDHYLCRGAVEKERAEFKHFHRLLCERFGYAHDEIDWKLDQLSLIEHIANSMLQRGVDHG